MIDGDIPIHSDTILLSISFITFHSPRIYSFSTVSRKNEFTFSILHLRYIQINVTITRQENDMLTVESNETFKDIALI